MFKLNFRGSIDSINDGIAWTNSLPLEPIKDAQISKTQINDPLSRFFQLHSFLFSLHFWIKLFFQAKGEEENIQAI